MTPKSSPAVFTSASPHSKNHQKVFASHSCKSQTPFKNENQICNWGGFLPAVDPYDVRWVPVRRASRRRWRIRPRRWNPIPCSWSQRRQSRFSTFFSCSVDPEEVCRVGFRFRFEDPVHSRTCLRWLRFLPRRHLHCSHQISFSWFPGLPLIILYFNDWNFFKTFI